MALLGLSGLTFAHDPTIVKEHGRYYRFQTGPGIPVFVSDNLMHWDIAGRVFKENPAWTAERIPGSKDFWAPEIVYRNGQWRLYYSVSTFGKNTSAIGLAVCPSIEKALQTDGADSSWTDRGAVVFSSPESDFNAIDPAVYADDAGCDRLLFGSFWGGLQLLMLDADGFVPAGQEPRAVASRIPYDARVLTEWRAGVFGNPAGEANPVEGGFVFPYQGFYYLFASHDFCCRGTASSYHIVLGRSDNPDGPFIDADGVDMLQGGGTLLRDGFSFSRWAGPGHNSVFLDDDGKTYLVYHSYDREHDGQPHLMIEELVWKDGWPL